LLVPLVTHRVAPVCIAAAATEAAVTVLRRDPAAGGPAVGGPAAAQRLVAMGGVRLELARILRLLDSLVGSRIGTEPESATAAATAAIVIVIVRPLLLVLLLVFVAGGLSL
jgi:hypothetical protein